MPRTRTTLRTALIALCLLVSAAAAQGPAYIELILDASGSMWNKLEDGRYRIVAAKDVLSQLIASLPEQEGLNVGLRVYGANHWASDPGACEDSHLLVPMQGVDRDRLLQTVRDTEALGATPIALSLELAARDFPAEGRKVIVLITDGIESCRSDLREVAERLKQQGIDVDLRIVGIDLDDSARAAFAGLGTFENATSAAELLGALNRAVEVTPAVETHRVTVTLTRDGAPATEGAAVEFLAALDGGEYDFRPGDAGGQFVADLPAGLYTARVRDAYSDAPLTVSGLTVTEGQNAYAFELAPEAEVTLTLSDEAPAAGSTVTVSYEGAPEGRGEVWLAPADAGDDVYLSYSIVAGPAGDVEVRVPDQTGEFEARYTLALPEGGYKVVGRAAFTVQAVTASLTLPAEVVAGATIEVEWEGPDNQGDFITIVPPDAPEGTWQTYAYTSYGNPVTLKAPEQPGDYEVRYATGQSAATLARATFTVTEATATVTAPAEVPAGADFEVAWTGPDNDGDYVTIVPADAPEGTYQTYAYTANGDPVTLRAPGAPGQYEVRYVTGGESVTLARAPVTVVAVSATVSAPRSAPAGAEIEVTWEGPDNPGDFITVVEPGTPEGGWGNYEYTSMGSPVTLLLPEEPGEYEVRYVAGTGDATLAMARVTAEPVTATVSAPASADAGSYIQVSWTGPDNRGDFITIVPAGEPEGAWTGNYAYVRDGNPVEILVPEEPGAYEVRYLTGQNYYTIASQPLTVR